MYHEHRRESKRERIESTIKTLNENVKVILAELATEVHNKDIERKNVCCQNLASKLIGVYFDDKQG